MTKMDNEEQKQFYVVPVVKIKSVTEGGKKGEPTIRNVQNKTNRTVWH
jgi:hypothetical protein